MAPKYNEVYGPGAALEVLTTVVKTSPRESVPAHLKPLAHWERLDDDVIPHHVWALMKDFGRFASEYDHLYGFESAEKMFTKQNEMRVKAGLRPRERSNSQDFGLMINPFTIETNSMEVLDECADIREFDLMLPTASGENQKSTIEVYAEI